MQLIMRALALALAAAVLATGAAQAATVSNTAAERVRLTSIASSDDAALAAFDGGFVARVRNPYDADILVDLIWAGSGDNRPGVSAAASGDTFFGWTRAEADAFCGASCTLRLLLGEDIVNTGGVLLTASGAQLDVKSINRFDYIAPIPVPAALPMMLAALAGLGFVARRRARG